jgi:Protein kinase domain/Putative DNA-binding domain
MTRDRRLTGSGADRKGTGHGLREPVPLREGGNAMTEPAAPHAMTSTLPPPSADGSAPPLPAPQPPRRGQLQTRSSGIRTGLIAGFTEVQPGDVLRDGRYEVERLLRSARDKSVYLGYDRKFDCQVTIDVFASNNATMPGGLTVSAWEAQVLGRLGNHPNVARVVDHWEDDKAAIMVSRYFSGGSLLELIAGSRESGEDLPVERILQVSAEIANGLAYIHGRRILYLDLQPRNVLFDELGTVHLVDFDTAVPFSHPDVSHIADRPVIVYTAPELTDGGGADEGADEGADLYSLGATLYEMAAGRPPFAGDREEILVARRAGPPPPLDRQDLPHALRDLVFSLLSAHREHRPASAAEVIKHLAGISTARADIDRLLTSDESARLELKASLRVPIDPPKPGDKRTAGELERALEREVIETLAAFLNTDGGTLIIGVTDDRKTVGIEVDYPRVKGTRDGWRLTFDHLVTHQLGAEVMNCIDLQLEPWRDRTIAVIRCSPREGPTWVGEELYVRCAASTEKLSTRHAVAWWRQRWGQVAVS